MGFRVSLDTIRPQPINLTFDGAVIEAYPGETIAAALIAGGIRGFRRDLCGGPRGPYCNMGTCFECVVEVRDRVPAISRPVGDGGGSWRTVRACLTQVHEGLEVRSRDLPRIEEPSA